MSQNTTVILIAIIIFLYAVLWSYLGAGGRIFFGVMMGLPVIFLLTFFFYKRKQ